MSERVASGARTCRRAFEQLIVKNQKQHSSPSEAMRGVARHYVLPVAEMYVSCICALNVAYRYFSRAIEMPVSSGVSGRAGESLAGSIIIKISIARFGKNQHHLM